MDHKKEENAPMDWERLTDDYLSRNLPLGVLAVDGSGIVRLWNTWLEIHCGKSAEGVLGLPLSEVIGGEHGRRVAETVQKAVESGLVMILAHRFHEYLIPVPLPMSSAPLSFMQQSAQIAPLRKEGKIVGAVILIQDVTDQVLRERELKQEIEEVEALNETLRKREKEVRRVKEEWERTFDAVPDLISILDTEHRILRVNKAMAERLGVAPEEAVGRHCFEAVHGLSAPPPFCPHTRLLRSGEPQAVEVFEERLHGFFQITVVPLYDDKGELLGSVHVAHDISERKQLIGLLEQLSYQDGLTGIANRRSFDETLEKEWRRAQREGAVISLVMLDIDFFKKYNDRYGHQAGDECLKTIAQSLKGILRRPGDLAARYGGEEFALLLPRTDSSGAVKIAEKVRTRIESLRLAHAGSLVSPWVTVSLGVATAVPRPESDPAELVRAADEALYQAKREGRNRVVTN